MGMSHDTFAALTIPEFEKAFIRWRDIREREERTPWEVMRLEVAMILQPFVKKEIDPKKILPLPWEKKHHTELTAEEKKHRTERVKKYLTTGRWD